MRKVDIVATGDITKHPNFQSLIGRKFNRVLVLNFVGIDARRRAKWNCKCDCGNTFVTLGERLKSGRTRSCSCLQKEKARVNGKLGTLPPGEAAKNKLIGQYKHSARERKISWELTDLEALKIFKENCFYCDTSPLQKAESKSGNSTFLFNGIDRVDNSKGYIISNVVACCSICNYAKHNLDIEKFIEWLGRIVVRLPFLRSWYNERVQG